MKNNEFKSPQDTYSELIKESGFFDSDWYLTQYPDVCLSGMGPLDHYRKYGMLLKRSPSRFFNSKEYVKRYPDVLSSNIDPLIHYLLYGKKEGRQIDFVETLDKRVVKELQKELENKVIKDLVDKARKRKNDKCLDATIARNESYDGRDILTAYATNYLYDYRQICRIIENSCEDIFSEEIVDLVTSSDLYLLIRLARLVATQRLTEFDPIVGLRIAVAIIKNNGEKCFSRSDAKFFLQLAALEKKLEYADFFLKELRTNRTDRNQLWLDLNHPQQEDEEDWINRFSDFWFLGLERVALKETKDSLSFLDRVYSHPKEIVENKILITVVISSWQPNEDQIFTSVKSILNQSWQNIEIIIVDDASEKNAHAIYEKLIRLDARIKVIYSDENKGTYNARNIALQHAKGDFVTFQDVDDWSHPRRLEKQASLLESDENIIACKSYAMRCYDDLRTSLPGSPVLQPNSSSLLFRREKVVSKIGYFDLVRKGGDTEYILRIEAEFGKGSVAEIEKKALAIVRLTNGSLSRSEFKPGWRHRSRSIYKESYQYWHKESATNNHSLYVSSNGNREKVFCPHRFSAISMPKSYDVVIIGDWRQFGGPQKSMIEEIKALLKYGKKVAVCHLEAFRFLSTENKAKTDKIQKVINEGVVDEVCLDDDINVGTIILRYPLILQFIPNSVSKWKFDKGIIVANQAPHELNGDDFRYYVTDCMENSKKLFGNYFDWAPMGPHVRKAVENKVPENMMLDNFPGIVSREEWHIEKKCFVADKPVIGRYSRDNFLKFPNSKKKLLQAYPTRGCYVKIMGGEISCDEITGGKIPDNWTLYPYGDVDVKDFLKEIDFFVYFDNPNIIEAFGRSILEAIASGVLVILHPKFKIVFGAAALYCYEEEVADLVNKHYELDIYMAQRDRAASYLDSNFSYASFLKLISL